MIKRGFLAVVCIVVLAGCATGRVWRHQTGHTDQQRFGVETMQCQQYAASVAPYRANTGQYDFAAAVLLGSRQAAYEAGFTDCMGRLGYYMDRAPVAQNSRPADAVAAEVVAPDLPLAEGQPTQFPVIR